MTESTPGAAPEELGAISALAEIIAALRVTIDEANGCVERAMASLTAATIWQQSVRWPGSKWPSPRRLH